MAVHTVNYLLRLLRAVLFLRDSRCLEIDPVPDESADWRGGAPAGRGRPLRATRAGMWDREQHLLRRTQHLQQLLIR